MGLIGSDKEKLVAYLTRDWESMQLQIEFFDKLKIYWETLSLEEQKQMLFQLKQKMLEKREQEASVDRTIEQDFGKHSKRKEYCPSPLRNDAVSEAEDLFKKISLSLGGLPF